MNEGVRESDCSRPGVETLRGNRGKSLVEPRRWGSPASASRWKAGNKEGRKGEDGFILTHKGFILQLLVILQ